MTASAVALVEQLRSEQPSLAIELVARGAPITEPAALMRLTELEVAVSVVIGTRAARFHPKLWLGLGPDGLDVLSGSGNLTAGGMRDNDEQFELLRVPADASAAIAAHEARFARLVEQAVPLSAVVGSRYWRIWQQQLDTRRRLGEQQQALDDALARNADAEVAVEALYHDLVALYERTKEEVEIVASDGSTRPYVASYFKRAIDQSRGDGSPVAVVARMVKSPTEGFHHLAAARRPDLMVESLVIDRSKPYHHLFLPNTVAAAQANLNRYAAQVEGES
ncbi:MAG: hypothetical protein ACTHOE_11315 [Conexibacter sp.]